MRGKIITVTMLTLLVASALDILVLPAVARVQQTGTQGPIYIRADGSVDPPTAPLTPNGNIYTLTDNIISVGTSDYSYSGITIQKSGVTLDGGGFTIQGTGFNSSPYAYAGVELFGVSDETVKNVVIKNFWYCIDATRSSRNNVGQNTFTGAVSDPIGHGLGCGVMIGGHLSYDNSIVGNTIVDCPAGIAVMFSSGNRISENNVTASSGYGISLDNSSNNILDGNIFKNNNIGMSMSIVYSSSGITEMPDSTNNTLYGNSFEANQFAVQITPSSGANCSGNRFFHNSFVNNTIEVQAGTHAIRSVESWDNSYPSGGNYWSDYTGLDLKSGPNQNQPGSDGIGDTPYFIDANNTDHYPLVVPFRARDLNVPVTFTFSGTVSGPITNGIVQVTSGSVTISGVVYQVSSSIPSGFNGSDLNVIYTSTESGGVLYSTAISLGNNLVMGLAGLYKLTDNELLSIVFGVGGPPFPGSTAITEGFNGQVLCGINAQGSLRVNGTSVEIVATGTGPSAAVYVYPSKTVVGEGYGLPINMTFMNPSYFSLLLNVSIYANATVIGTETGVTVSNGTSTTSTFSLNTTGLAYGNYTISACVWPVPNETSTANSNFTGGWVMISMVGDITGLKGWPDGTVDMRDIGYVAKRFSADPSKPLWDPNADINGDGKIDMKDISLVARHFGEHYP